MILRRFTLAFTGLVMTCSSAWSAESNTPFERGALNAQQQNAWHTYITNEAAAFGCEYGDDPRLSEAPEALFSQLASNADIPPVRITYRSLMNMGPNTRALIANNVNIASVECNSVYYTGEEIIGMPIIPFEEALTILHDDLANYDDPKRIRALNRTFVVANLDPRWFWSFFIADKGHMDLLGYDFNTLVRLEQILNNRDEPLTYDQDNYRLLSHIFDSMHNYGIDYYAASGECTESTAEPADELIVWPEITDVIVRNFYLHHDIPFEGKWKTRVKVEEGGITLYQQKGIDNPSAPLFNVTRGLTIKSAECK